RYALRMFSAFSALKRPSRGPGLLLSIVTVLHFPIFAVKEFLKAGPYLRVKSILKLPVMEDGLQTQLRRLFSE
ncbi:HMA domain-containing protein, partial [Dysosmobacter welbionis]